MNLQKNFLRSTDVSIKILFLTLFFCLHAFAKNQDPVRLFNVDHAQESNWKALRSKVNIRVITYNQEVLNNLKIQRPKTFSIMVPSFQGDLELQLEENKVLADGFILNSDKQAFIPYTPGLYYKGKIAGDDQSSVAISFFDDEVMGIISPTGQSNLVIGKSSALRSNSFMLFDQSDVIGPDFNCKSEDLPHWADKLNTAGSMGNLRSSAAKCINVYFELGNSMYVGAGNSESAAANFITGIFNATTTIYSNEQISTSISQIKVWTTAEPYGAGASNGLTDFGNALSNGFNGNLAHLVRLTSGSASGVAWLDELCGGLPYAYSEVFSSYSAYPSYSWSVNVVTHEMGHNVGSPHTHSCSWPGGPIDGCYAHEGNCSSDGPIPPANGGTIMSYCHLKAGVGISLTNGFGPLPGNLIRSRYNSAGCLATCGSTSGGGGGGTTPTPADYKISAIAISPNTISSAATPASLSFTVGNTGGAATVSSTTRVYLSSDNTLSNNDATVSDITFPAIGASGSASTAFNVTLPSNSASGIYYYFVCADVANVISESSETNNCSSVALTLSISTTPTPTPPPTPPAQPDLTIGINNSIPSSANAGTQFSINGFVKNIGSGLAGSSNLAIALSTDAALSNNDISLFTSNIPSLATNGSSEFSAPITIPNQLSQSNYYVVICADANNAVSESNENNNCTSYAINISIPKPDLTISNVKFSPTPVLSSSPFSINYDVQNIGQDQATGSTTALYLSANSTLDGADQLLGESPAQALTQGSTYQGAFNVTKGFDAGNYYIIVCADSKNSVIESSENNNCVSTAISIINALPDLTVDVLDADKIVLNKVSPIKIRIKNIGTKKNAITTVANLYLSGSPDLDGSSVYLATVNIPLLDVNGFTDTTINYVLTNPDLEGNRYLVLCIDPNNRISELSKNNNCKSDPVTVLSPLPDLKNYSSVSFGTIGKGGFFDFPFLMTNIGVVPSDSVVNEFYLSFKPLLKGGGSYRVALDTVKGISPGDTLRKKLRLQIPEYVPIGTYYLNVCIDFNNKLQESSKTNNCQTMTINIRNPLPDLAVNTFGFTDSLIFVNAPFNLKLNISNLGEANANPSQARIWYSTGNDTTSISNFTLDTLKAFTHKDTSFKIVLPNSAAGKKLKFEVTVAPVSDYKEISTDNNKSNFIISPTRTLPDLFLSNITGSDSLYIAGKSALFKYLLGNSGKIQTDSFTIDYQIVDTARKVVFGDSKSFGSESGNKQDTVAYSLTIPVLKTGKYNLVITADSKNVIEEISKKNNSISFDLPIKQLLPDIYISNFSIQDSVSSGKLYTAHTTIKNQGEETMPACQVMVYYSTDEIMSDDDLALDTLTTIDLQTDQSESFDFSIRLPEKLSYGTGHIITVLDRDDHFEESNKENNIDVHDIIIPDLRPDLNEEGLQVVQPTIKTGSDIDINIMVKNDGLSQATAFNYEFALMKDINDVKPVILVDSMRYHESLKSGDYVMISNHLRIPETVLPGSYYLVSCLDTKHEVDEKSKNNNCGQLNISIEKISNTINTTYFKPTVFSTIKTYPNPTTNVLHLQGQLDKNTAKQVTLLVHDIAGQVVKTETLNSTELINHTIDVSNLHHGLYTLQLISNSSSWKQIFVKL